MDTALRHKFLSGGVLHVEIAPASPIYAQAAALLAAANRRRALEREHQGAIPMSAAGQPVPADAYREMATFYAELWNTLESQGEEVPEAEFQAARDELADGDWVLTRGKDGWEVKYAAELESADPVQMSAARAIGYTKKSPLVLNGHQYWGGMWIPSDQLATAPPEVQQQVQERNEKHLQGARQKRQDRGPVNVDALHKRLEEHARQFDLSAPQNAIHRRSAEMMFRALYSHHDNLTAHRIEELTGETHRALGKLGEDDPRRAELQLKLAKLHHALGMAQKAKAPPKPAEDAPWTGQGEPEHGKVYNAPTDALHVDPSRFQYKLNVNKEGVTEELKGIQHWNPDFAGVISVWKDPKDGKTHVVNGHHRSELARRLGVKNLAVRYIDAKSPEEARGVGALINIAEGRGTAVDAAKFMRDVHASPEDLEKHGVSLKGAVARDAALLTDLSNSAFDKLARGTLDQPTALAVAKHLKDHDRQDLLFGRIAKREEDGKPTAPRVVEEMARMMAHVSEGEKGEDSLFGGEAEPLFDERAELTAHVRGELGKEVNDFLAVSSKRRAERVGKGGQNVLDTEANKKIALEGERVKNVFDKLANRKGGISDALNEAAADYAKAKTKKEKEGVRKQALEKVRHAVFAEAGLGQPPGQDVQGGAAARPVEPGAGAPAAAPDAGRREAAPAGLNPAGHQPPEQPAPAASPRREAAANGDPAVSPEHVSAAKRQLKAGTLKVKGSAKSEPVTSALSGETIRRHVELPGGAKVHPDELDRATVGEDGRVALNPHEGVEVKDPSGLGGGTHGSFGRALEMVAKTPGRDSDRVTLQSPHGYSATKTRGEWRQVQRQHAQAPGSMAAWFDRENPEPVSAAAQQAEAPAARQASDKESEAFFQPEAQPAGLFNYQTKPLSPDRPLTLRPGAKAAFDPADAPALAKRLRESGGPWEKSGADRLDLLHRAATGPRAPDPGAVADALRNYGQGRHQQAELGRAADALGRLALARLPEGRRRGVLDLYRNDLRSRPEDVPPAARDFLLKHFGDEEVEPGVPEDGTVAERLGEKR